MVRWFGGGRESVERVACVSSLSLTGPPFSQLEKFLTAVTHISRTAAWASAGEREEEEEEDDEEEDVCGSWEAGGAGGLSPV